MAMRTLCLLTVLILSSMTVVMAQPIDSIIGLKRTKVQQILRPYRILDYQRDRVSYQMDKGVRQTVLYINDTCTSFHWAVSTPQLASFLSSLEQVGYVHTSDGTMVKDGLSVDVRTLESGKATLLTVKATSAPTLTATDKLPEVVSATSKETETTSKTTSGRKRPDRYANVPMNRGRAVVIDLPLMQQEALLEKADTTRMLKDPTRNWVGEAQGEAKFLGF